MRTLLTHLHIHVPLLLTLAVLSTAQAEKDPKPKRVAIIGAGAAGSSTAYHLAQYARNASLPVAITVVDRNAYVGGRSTTVPVYDDPEGGQSVELGASIFVPVNRILVAAVKEFGLETEGFGGERRKGSKGGEEQSGESDSAVGEVGDEDGEGESEVLGVWNGEEFVFTQELGKLKWWQNWWMKGKLLWRYGLAPLRTVNLMKSVTGKFFQMYDEPVFPWREGLSQAVEDVGLLGTTAFTGEQFLETNSIGQAFAREIIQSSTRVNYAQNLGLIHGLETMVCMATEGAMSVSGGNYQIFAGMLDASSAHVDLSTEVQEVHRQKDGKYRILAGENANSKDTSAYDAVVLATPYHQAGIKFSSSDKNDEFPSYVPPDIPYVTLHVTLFASPYRLSPQHFNLTSRKEIKKGSASTKEEEVPDVILTTLPESQQSKLGGVMDGANVGKAGFFSISALRQVNNTKTNPPRREYVYKIFSPDEISDSFLNSLVRHKSSSTVESSRNEQDVLSNESSNAGEVTWIRRHTWKSYPYLPPRVTFEEQKLDEFGLWYTSGIESFISTMETSALMGANVAKLIIDGWDEASNRESQLSDNERHQDL